MTVLMTHKEYEAIKSAQSDRRVLSDHGERQRMVESSEGQRRAEAAMSESDKRGWTEFRMKTGR